ncbi:uncharacterized protein LOC143301383 [Babylonia areolata]|uniref:uncharacterized protein LOC143301383 n=1 Tax=Babylonia areolata TaxID=304850 RepID=UPI003FD167D3
MEVKVWVDGLQRVVCGASWDTTCQDVVIALAHAMGRTGRFTLVEKWRDNERPLTPAERPLHVLHKWGEYAAEVRFVLCQAGDAAADRKKARATVSQDRLARMEKSVSMHRIVSPRTQAAAGAAASTTAAEPSVKRSLTFSGAHHPPAAEDDDPAWMTSAMPTSKIRKTQQGPVPNGDMRQRAHHPLQSSTQVRQVRGERGTATTPAPSSSSSSLSPSQNHHHHHHQGHVSPSRQGQSHPHSNPSDPAPSSLSSALSHRHLGDVNRPSAFQPPKNLRSRAVSPAKPTSSVPEEQAHPRSPSPPQSRLQPQPGDLPQSSPDPRSQTPSPSRTSVGLQQVEPQPRAGPQPQAGPRPHGPEQQENKANPPSSHSKPDPLPHSPVARSRPSSVPVTPQEDSTRPANLHPPTLESSRSSYSPCPSSSSPAGVPDPSSQACPQIEEYDLDHNFPPTSHRDWNHNEAPPNSQEYRLEEGLGSGSGLGSGVGGQLEGEHAKLLRLVNMQQQRLKTQESQIGLVNTEISNLEEKEMEYEENLHVIMEELLLQENRQRELEPQLSELEKVEWETALEEEKKREINLTLEVASCKAAILEHEQKLDDLETQESELLEEIKQEEEKLSQERDRQEREEARRAREAEEEESKAKEAISELQTQISDLEQKGEECATSLSQVEGELSVAERSLKEKGQVLEGLEASLKEGNMKDFGNNNNKTSSSSHASSNSDTSNNSQSVVAPSDMKAEDSQKMLRKILEDSLSPRLADGFHDDGGLEPKPPGPPLLAAFATSNQSGVWV